MDKLLALIWHYCDKQCGLNFTTLSAVLTVFQLLTIINLLFMWVLLKLWQCHFSCLLVILVFLGANVLLKKNTTVIISPGLWMQTPKYISLILPSPHLKIYIPNFTLIIRFSCHCQKKCRLFCTHACAQCHIHFFHHVKFYFRFILQPFFQTI